ncbi:MAG TPA: hypothetical protein DCO77_09785 [Nitrospiraceae bacterium]|nr:hypothetical protein [Nitrospiraceae bacterium]
MTEKRTRGEREEKPSGFLEPRAHLVDTGINTVLHAEFFSPFSSFSCNKNLLMFIGLSLYNAA